LDKNFDRKVIVKDIHILLSFKEILKYKGYRLSLMFILLEFRVEQDRGIPISGSTGLSRFFWIPITILTPIRNSWVFFEVEHNLLIFPGEGKIEPL